MSKKKSPSNGTPAIKFDYIKSNFFRVVHADGVWGGVTPRGQIHMAFWNERPPIPRQSAFEVTPEGKLGEELTTERVTRDALVCEVDVSVVMDSKTAKSFVNWLLDKIKKAEEQGQG